mmetsp:Transcript_30275/g.96570  ORF Transcript_30275/g.96570 Transcript_30275/m.96570 type:complete len:231 (-) Transcript_30275:721-1413(-)
MVDALRLGLCADAQRLADAGIGQQRLLEGADRHGEDAHVAHGLDGRRVRRIHDGGDVADDGLRPEQRQLALLDGELEATWQQDLRVRRCLDLGLLPEAALSARRVVKGVLAGLVLVRLVRLVIVRQAVVAHVMAVGAERRFPLALLDLLDAIVHDLLLLRALALEDEHDLLRRRVLSREHGAAGEVPLHGERRYERQPNVFKEFLLLEPPVDAIEHVLRVLLREKDQLGL